MEDWNSERSIIDEYDIKRFIFDNLSNIFLLLILMQIVAGIIIDKFADMRNRSNIAT